MAVKEKQSDSSEEIDWNVENEIQLLFAMNGHKPVGVNKYFHMVCIWEKFRAAIHKDVSLKAIWDQLKTMYDLMSLDDNEDVPFPSNETDFSLPDNEYSELMMTRRKEETEVKPKEIKEKVKEEKGTKKEKEVKETVKKDIVLRDTKTVKDTERKKDDVKKVSKEPEVKKETKLRETKDVKKEQKATKGRLKGKDELEDTGPPMKKERKDSESSRESLKRPLKRSTRQSTESSSKTSASPRDTPPLKRRRT